MCIGRWTPSHPENHDASLSAAAENLALYSLSYAHRGLRVPFYEYNVLPANLSAEPAAPKGWKLPDDPVKVTVADR